MAQGTYVGAGAMTIAQRFGGGKAAGALDMLGDLRRQVAMNTFLTCE
jgi:hypothetical protein